MRKSAPLGLGMLLIMLLLFTSGVLAQDSQAEQEQTIHVVQPGENLYRIALRYGVTVAELAAANEIVDTSRVYRGQSLIIPGVFTPTADEVYNPLVAGTPTIHVVQPGETLSGIARKYGVADEAIMQANDIANPNLIYRGQSLSIWGVASTETSAVQTDNVNSTGQSSATTNQAVPSSGTVPYTVQPGEHLSQIAQRYGLSWPTLAQINGIADPNRVYAGQILQIPALDENGQVRLDDIGIIQLQGPGATIPVGKQIVVDLSEQRTYAYEDGVLVYATIVSTGLPDTPTVTGDFTIYIRLESQRMVGPDYDLPNVQWVQYFYQGYGLHGTYWHNNFGRPMSHGCVNMTNQAAEWFYKWADYGTPVHVQY